jgi:hypothetical protein
MMPDTTAPPDPALKAEFDRARVANDFDAMQRLGVLLYPAPAGARDPFAGLAATPPRPEPLTGNVTALRSELSQPLLPARRREEIAAALVEHYQTTPDVRATPTVDPPPDATGPLVAAPYAATSDPAEQGALVLPADVTVDQKVLGAVLAGAETVGLGRAWMQKLIDFDLATRDEDPDTSEPPDPGAVAVAREVIGFLPTSVQRHVHARRHLERAAFVNFVAKVGEPLLRRSVTEQSDVRNAIARRFYDGRRPTGEAANRGSYAADRAARITAAYAEQAKQ